MLAGGPKQDDCLRNEGIQPWHNVGEEDARLGNPPLLGLGETRGHDLGVAPIWMGELKRRSILMDANSGQPGGRLKWFDVADPIPTHGLVLRGVSTANSSQTEKPLPHSRQKPIAAATVAIKETNDPRIEDGDRALTNHPSLSAGVPTRCHPTALLRTSHTPIKTSTPSTSLTSCLLKVESGGGCIATITNSVNTVRSITPTNLACHELPTATHLGMPLGSSLAGINRLANKTMASDAPAPDNPRNTTDASSRNQLFGSSNRAEVAAYSATPAPPMASGKNNRQRGRQPGASIEVSFKSTTGGYDPRANVHDRCATPSQEVQRVFLRPLVREDPQPRYIQPSCFRLTTSFQTLVIWRIRSPSNCMM